MSFVDSPTSIDRPGDVPKKRTRRRLRVSCVECTRRRQKCDRQQPCSLCKRRGVEHLCRWETEPFARPPPARPPARAGILMKRDKPLDLITSWQTNSASSPAYSQYSPASRLPPPWPSAVASPSSLSQPGLSSRTSLSPIESSNEGLKEAAMALARLSLTGENHRLGEGSLVCALQELIDPITPGSSELPSTGRTQSSIMIRSSQSYEPRLPDKAHCEALLMSFLEHVNWAIGVPQTVLFSVHERMWAEIRADPTSLGGFNPSWLSLLFAMFASSPACSNEEESRDYFNQALAARKLEEDRYSSLDSPPPSHDTRGAVYSCLAASFLARYLQDRGRVAEAWRMIGNGLRDAQNAGLERYLAPGKSKHMSIEERTFMLVTWHLCVEFDRFLSLFLGRPTIIRSRDCNVQPPSARSEVLAPDGSTNIALLFQHYFISLTGTVSDLKEKFLSVHPDLEDGHASFDIRMAEWLSSLPTFYTWRQPPDTSYDHLYPKLYLQRLTLRAYYCSSCLLFHRALAYTRPAHHPPAGYGVQHSWDQSQLAQYAINVLHAQGDLLLNQWWERQVPFDISMHMFEAAVTLGVTLLRDLSNPRAEEWRRELARAIGVFENMRARDFGKIVAQAIQALRVLQDLCYESKAKAVSDDPVAQGESKAYVPIESHDNAVLPATSASSFGGLWIQQDIHNTAPVPPYPYEGTHFTTTYPIWTTSGMTTPVVGRDPNLQYT